MALHGSTSVFGPVVRPGRCEVGSPALSIGETNCPLALKSDIEPNSPIDRIDRAHAAGELRSKAFFHTEIGLAELGPDDTPDQIIRRNGSTQPSEHAILSRSHE